MAEKKAADREGWPMSFVYTMEFARSMHHAKPLVTLAPKLALLSTSVCSGEATTTRVQPPSVGHASNHGGSLGVDSEQSDCTGLWSTCSGLPNCAADNKARPQLVKSKELSQLQIWLAHPERKVSLSGVFADPHAYVPCSLTATTSMFM